MRRAISGHSKWSRLSLTKALLKHRWLLLFLLSASAVIFEILEHQDVKNPVDIHFAREIVFFGIIYPLAISLLISTLLQVQEQRNYVLRQREIEQKLNLELGMFSKWEDLCRKIIDFLVSVTPSVGVRLLLLSKESTELNLETNWWLIEPSQRAELQTPTPIDFCGVTDHTLERHLHPLLPRSEGSKVKGYCLPLLKDDCWLGSINLFLASQEHLSVDQIRILNDIAPSIASYIYTARINDSSESKDAAIKVERERIARQLHDTMGQNLAYITLKLDQISAKKQAIIDISAQQDLDRLRDIACEAQEQIREIMITLKAEQGEANLTELILTQAEVAAQQGGFAVRPLTSGEAIPLPPAVQRKILGIVRETLYNIQRHAHAKTVTLSINWDAPAACLTVALEDDGIGFEPSLEPARGHFGINIMQQRADEIAGQLTIDAAPSKGTRVILRCPLSQVDHIPL